MVETSCGEASLLNHQAPGVWDELPAGTEGHDRLISTATVVCQRRPVLPAVGGVRLGEFGMRELLKSRPPAGRAWAAALLVLAALTWTAAPAAPVHESHHGPFIGTTSQDERFFMRGLSRTRVGDPLPLAGDL
jgi:hypothetical protein